MDESAGPAKRVELEKRESTFGSSSGRTRSYQEEAAVTPDLRSALESIGMRTRFNVGRGYGSPPPSQLNGPFDVQDSLFASDRDILQSVKSRKSVWNRTKSAPLYQNELIPFCGLRADLVQDENDDPSQEPTPSHSEDGISAEMDAGVGIGLGDLKRNRDEVFGQWADEDKHDTSAMDVDAKPISALPRRSSPTSAAGTSLREAAHTMPASAGLSSYLAAGQKVDWTNDQFSAFTSKTDF